jgi:Asp-tRNA(Asn)/Glu-tRNA(Gln) amidotransferase A subunit family amidase
MEPTARSLRQIAGDMRSGRLTAEAITRACLDKIAAREGEVQAWAWLDSQAVIAAARAQDASGPRRPLHGIPFGVKDVIDTADMPTAYGSPIYDGHRPVADAAVVAAIRDCGGLVLGKTVTCEFAGGLPSLTRNPHHPGHTPGGSSSGSAAAVAAEMVPVALGTQTAGSIVRPASFCGVVGYKPTFGTINLAGVKPLSETMDTVGLFAARVDDAAFAAAALAQRPELADEAPLPRPPRLLVCRTDRWDAAGADGAAALEQAVAALLRSGASVRDGALPFSCAALTGAGMTILATDARAAFGHELRTAPDLVSAKMHEFLALPKIDDRSLYDAAVMAVETARGQFDAMFGDIDVVLTLAAPGEAPAGLGTTGNAAFNFVWTLLHGPALAVPGLSGPTGLPIGVQLIGPRRGDARLLQVGRWVEAALA